MATRADVARLAGVAESTVSYVLNGSRPIGPDARARVLAAMDALSYAPNALARGLASRRSGVLLLHVPATERGIHATELEYIQAVTEAARSAGMQVVLDTMDPTDLDGLRKLLAPGLFDGAVLMEARTGDSRVGVLQAAQVPFAVIGRTGHEVPSVDADFEAGGRLAVEFLAGLGHQRIALLSQPASLLLAHYGPVERIEASMRAAAAAGGVALDVVHVGQSVRAGHAAFADLVGTDGVTAVASVNEPATTGLVLACLEHGLRIPRDLSILALGIGETSAESMIPTLTTVSASPLAMGRRAVEIVTATLHEPATALIQELVPMELVVRESTSPRN